MQSFLAIPVSNLVVAFGLALIAFLVGRVCRKPAVTHCLWVLVLVKLLTPPLVEFPVPVDLGFLSIPAAVEDTLGERVAAAERVPSPASATGRSGRPDQVTRLRPRPTVNRHGVAPRQFVESGAMPQQLMAEAGRRTANSMLQRPFVVRMDGLIVRAELDGPEGPFAFDPGLPPDGDSEPDLVGYAAGPDHAVDPDDVAAVGIRHSSVADRIPEKGTLRESTQTAPGPFGNSAVIPANVKPASVPAVRSEALSEGWISQSAISELASVFLHSLPWLTVLWLAGSLVTGVLIAVRLWRFSRLLQHTMVAPQGLEDEVAELARELELAHPPEVRLVSGAMSPMLWCFGSRARIIFPVDLISRLDVDERKSLLLHELAHFRRGDHWVRWLEIVTTVTYWWCPLVWLARRELRRVEEDCCDAWVVSQRPDCRPSYARAIVNTIDFLAEQSRRLPATATGLSYFRSLHSRITQIMTGTASRGLTGLGRVTVAVLALLLLPLVPRISDSAEADDPQSDANVAVVEPESEAPSASVIDGTDESGTEGSKAAPADKQQATENNVPTTRGLKVRLGVPGGETRPRPSAAAVQPLSEPTQFQTGSTTLRGGAPEVRAIAVSNDGSRVLVGHGNWQTSGLIRLWDPEAKRILASVNLRRGVPGLAISPRGDVCATATWDGNNVHIRDLETLQERYVLRHGGPTRVAFSPDGSLLATVTESKQAVLWNVETGRQTLVLGGEPFRMQHVAWSPDGRLIAAGGGSFGNPRNGVVAFWDAGTGRRLHTLRHHTQPVLHVSFSSDSARIVAGSLDASATICEAAAGEVIQTLRGHRLGLECAEFSPDGLLIATASYDGTMKLWDAGSGEMVSSAPGTRQAFSAAFSPDGETVYWGGQEGRVQIWRTTAGSEGGTLTPEQSDTDSADGVFALAYSPDGQLIASAHEDATVRLRRTDGQVTGMIHGHDDVVSSLAFSSDGRGLVTGSFDGAVKVWRLPDNLKGAASASSQVVIDEAAQSFSHDGNWVLAVAFAPSAIAGDALIVASAGYDRTIRLWDADHGEQIAVLHGHTAAVRSLAFTPDGRRLASAGSDRVVRLWDVDSAIRTGSLEGSSPVAVFKGHEKTVRAISVTPDGAFLASGSEDQTIKLWDLAKVNSTPNNGVPLEVTEPARELSGAGNMIWSLSFTPQGRRLVSGGFDGVVSVWNPNSGQRTQQLRGHNDAVAAIAFAPDTSRILTGSYDTTMRVWPASGPPVPVVKPLSTIDGRQDSVQSVAWSPDGRLFAISRTGDVQIRSVKSGQVVRTLNSSERSQDAEFSPDGGRIAVVCQTGVLVWDVRSGDQLAKLEHEGARRLAWSPDGRKLASIGWDRHARLWHADTGEALGVTSELPMAGSGVVFTATGDQFVTCTGSYREWQQPGHIDLWNVDDCTHVARIGQSLVEIKDVVVVSQTAILSYGPDGTRFWSLPERRQLLAVNNLPGITAEAVGGIAGRYLVAGDVRGQLTIFDRRTNRRVADLEGHSSNMYSLAVSPDGTTLLSASRDGSVRLWAMPTSSQNAPIEARAYLFAADVSPRGLMLMLPASNGLQIRTVATGELARQLGSTTTLSGVFSADGRRAYAGLNNGRIVGYDLRTSDEVFSWRAHEGEVRALALSPDGKLLASGSRDGVLALRDLASQKEIRRSEGYTGGVWMLAFSPDGTLLATGRGDDVDIIDVETLELKKKIKGPGSLVSSVAFTPSGSRILMGVTDGTLVVVDLETGQPVASAKVHESRVTGIRIAKNSQAAFTSGYDGRVVQWDLTTGLKPRLLGMHAGKDKPRVNGLAMTPDGRRVFSAGANQFVRTWDVTGESAVSQIGRWIALESSAGKGEFTEEAVVEAHSQTWWVAWHPNGELLASGGSKGGVTLWDRQSLTKTAELKTGSGALVAHGAFSPDGRLLAACDTGRSVYLWNVETREIEHRFSSQTAFLRKIAFSPDGAKLAVASEDGTIAVHDLEQKKQLFLCESDTIVAGLAFTPDGKHMLSSGGDWKKRVNTSVRVWNADDGSLLHTLPNSVSLSYGLTVSPRGHAAARGSNGTVSLWDYRTGAEQRKFSAARSCRCAAFSPDGELLIVCGSSPKDPALWLFDVDSGRLIAETIPHKSTMFCGAFSPDGKQIATSSGDGTFKIWSWTRPEQENLTEVTGALAGE